MSGEAEESLPEPRTDLTVLFTRILQAHAQQEEPRGVCSSTSYGVLLHILYSAYSLNDALVC